MLRTRNRRLALPAVTVGVGVLAFAACRDAAPTAADAPASSAHAAHAATSSGSEAAGIGDQLAALRALTAPFHRIEAAAEAGWSSRITGCFSSADGGMGYHYGNVSLIDGRVDASEPELLLYEPRKNGDLRLVAVEYIVPFGLWTAAEPPSLFGQSFHRNEAFGLWVLHVWHFRHNPNGTFADWNPMVSCQYALD